MAALADLTDSKSVKNHPYDLIRSNAFMGRYL